MNGQHKTQVQPSTVLSTLPPAAARNLQRKCACGGTAGPQGECEDCKAKRLARASRNSAGESRDDAVPSIVNDVLRSPGQPLDATSLAFMEERFAHDFSDVRIHHDAQAAESALAVEARAYTVGNDIVFGAGEHSPTTESGRHLLAHELAHTVQQQSAPVSSEMDASASAERDADRAADAVMNDQTVAVKSGTAAGLQREPLPGALPGSDALIENVSPFLASAIGSTTLAGFDSGKADLKPEHRTELAKTAHNINVLLRKYPMSTVTVTGFTDTVGTEAYNMTLGEERAQRVRQALIDLQVPESIVVAESKGEGSPQAVKTGNEVSNAGNRRVEVRFRPEGFSVRLPVPDLTLTPPEKPVPLPKPNLTLPRWPIDIKPPNPNKLPPDFWKPLPPPVRGAGPKSPLDIINEKIVDPVVDAVTGFLPRSAREKVKEAARDAVKSGITKGARAAAEAAGVTDPQALQAIEKAVEAAIQEKGQNQQP